VEIVLCRGGVDRPLSTCSPMVGSHRRVDDGRGAHSAWMRNIGSSSPPSTLLEPKQPKAYTTSTTDRCDPVAEPPYLPPNMSHGMAARYSEASRSLCDDVRRHSAHQGAGRQEEVSSETDHGQHLRAALKWSVGFDGQAPWKSSYRNSRNSAPGCSFRTLGRTMSRWLCRSFKPC
jgi:hypothetical protein